MDSLSKTLYSVVSQAVGEFAQAISTKYNLPREELLELWNSNVSSDLKAGDTSLPKKERKSVTKKTKSPEDNHEAPCCSYEFKKGANQGKKCTAKVSGGDSTFCRKHKEQEGKEVKEDGDKTVKKSSRVGKKSSDDSEKDSSVVKKLTEGKPAYVLKRNSHGNYEHPETKFVFDKVTREVYGRQTDNGVVDLTVEEVEQCKRLNFKHRLPVSLTTKNEACSTRHKDSKRQVSDDEEEDVEEEEEEVEEEEEEDD
jgi:hypothetical protein